MKFAIIAATLFAFSAQADDGLSKEALLKLNEFMGAKVLSCKPRVKRKTDPKWRGDDGYFKIRMEDGQPAVFDNGGEGYGFSNGGVYGLTFDDSIMYMRAGDDGFQILTFDFDRLDVEEKTGRNCAPGVLTDASNFDLLDTFMLNCCLD